VRLNASNSDGVSLSFIRLQLIARWLRSGSREIDWQSAQANDTEQVKPGFAIVAYVNVLIANVLKIPIWREVRIGATQHLDAHKLRLSRIIAASLLFVGSAQSTSLVILRLNSVVVIGADSLIVSLDAGDPSAHRCKIHQISRNRFAAFGGVTESTLYDPVVIAKGFVNRSIAEEATGFDDAIRSYLEETVRIVLQHPQARERMRKQLAGEVPWFTTAFVEYDGRTTRVASTETFVSSIVGAEIKLRSGPVHSCPGDCANGNILWQLATHNVSTQEARAMIDQSSSSPDAVVRIVMEEAKRSPDVGLPISILTVEPTRAYWSPGNSEGCEAIQLDRQQSNSRFLGFISAALLILVCGGLFVRYQRAHH